MDRIVIQCKSCGRPLSVLPTMKARKCAACGANTKIAAFQREQAVPISETAEKVAKKAKKNQIDQGKTVVVKRLAARPITDEVGDA
jgi:LSD1 subclass zinc finger protein